MFRRKKEATATFKNRLSTTPPDLALARFLMDTGMPEYQQLQTILGLGPLDDVEEESNSEERLYAVSPMQPLARLFCASLAVAAMEYLRSTSDGEAFLDDEELSGVVSLLHRVSYAATIGTITQLEDLGLIEYTYRRK